MIPAIAQASSLSEGIARDPTRAEDFAIGAFDENAARHRNERSAGDGVRRRNEIGLFLRPLEDRPRPQPSAKAPKAFPCATLSLNRDVPSWATEALDAASAIQNHDG